MQPSKRLAPSPTDLIDWLNFEGILDLDWDFPEDGDLLVLGLNSTATVQALVGAVQDQYGVELAGRDLTAEKLATPRSLAALIGAKLGGA